MLNKKLKVMHLILNLDIGGAQEVVRTLVESLDSDRCLPIVGTFNDGPLRPSIEQLGIPVEIVPGRRYSILALPLFVVDIVRIWRSLARLIREYEIEVIQTHILTGMDFLVLLLKYTTRLHVVVWTFHSFNFQLSAEELPRFRWLLKPKRYLHRQLYRLSANLTDGFIAVSDEVKTAMVKIIGPIQDRITVIYNGVNVKQYSHTVDQEKIRRNLGLRPDAYVVTMVGTLKKVKGHCFMIEAMSSLVPEYSNLQLLLVGDGELRNELERQVDQLGLREHIHFLGSRNDVPEVLAASDVFVLPSLWEGMSMALLEAMVTGLPIIASEVSGTVRLLTQNETGLLVPPGDVQELVGAMERLLSDSDRSWKMGRAARERVITDFSARKQAEEHLTLYHQLLGYERHPNV